MTRRARLARFVKKSAPVLLDISGFAAITYGVYLLAGAYAWIVAGALLILAGYSSQS